MVQEEPLKLIDIDWCFYMNSPGCSFIVRHANMLLNSTTSTDSSGFTISVHSAHEQDNISSSRYTLCLRYRGLLPNCSHSLIDFAVHLSMSTFFTFLADVLVLALFGCQAASVWSIESMSDVRSFSRFSTLSLTSLTSFTCSFNTDTIWCDDSFVVLNEL